VTTGNQSIGYLRDASLWFLLVSNLATIFFAVNAGWDLLTILWIYWAQSIIIGLFNVVRILQLKAFSAENFYINGELAKPTRKTKNYTAGFFLIHYGFFHLIYAIFLFTGAFVTPSIGSLDIRFVLLSTLIFFINHLFSYIYNKPRDIRKQNIGVLMFYPYARILPMHLAIIIGVQLTGGIVFFLTLKTVADCIMHIVEHRHIRG
jgi:hypothetical protein